MLYEENLTAIAISSAALVMVCVNNKNKNKKRRRWWQTKLYKRRSGEELMLDMATEMISGHYKNFTRMSPTCFEELLSKIGPRISKQNTYFRSAISAQDRLAVTLRYLATGDSYTSLQYLFRISKQCIGRIIPEVCAALVEELKGYVKCPTTQTTWKGIWENFETDWNLPHCVGALDGKHIILQAPIKSGTEYYNYKGGFSIVLMALVDAKYNFIFADVGCQGRISDGGVFKNCELYKKIVEEKLGLPPKEVLPGRQIKVPYFFVADKAFTLSKNIMKPYSGEHPRGSAKRIFNYRLSRARCVVENAFGISSAVFRVLRKPMLLAPDKAEIIVMCVILLHNYLRTQSPNLCTPPGSLDYEENGAVIEGSWKTDTNMTSMQPLRNIPKRSGTSVEKVRDEIADYCIKEGSLPWQHLYA